MGGLIGVMGPMNRICQRKMPGNVDCVSALTVGGTIVRLIIWVYGCTCVKNCDVSLNCTDEI